MKVVSSLLLRVNLSLLFAATLSACGMFGAGSHLENVNTTSNSTNNANTVICQANSLIEQPSCSAEISHSTSAHKDKTCSADGKSSSLGACVLDSCESGYLKQGNACIVQACVPNSSHGNVSCVGEIAQSAMATKSKDCNGTGLDFIYGSCQLQQCINGYYKSGNNCVVQSCTPNLIDSVDCKSELLNAAIAEKSRTCNSLGNNYTYGSCILQTCSAGYYKSGNVCVMQACVPDQSNIISCAADIPHSIVAEKSQTCSSNGSSYIYGSCSLQTCEAGYYKSGNSCVAQSCTPNQMDSVDCKAELPNSATAQKSRTCNSLGDNYTYGSCQLQTCEAGYYKSGNVCVVQACTPDQTSMISCAAEIPNSMTAEKSQTCNSNGSGYNYGSCSLQTCEAGYYKAGNSCLPQVCNPGDATAVDCKADIINSLVATKSKTCNSAGAGYDYGVCTATSCITGYEVSAGGLCVFEPMPYVSITGIQTNSMSSIIYMGVDSLGRVVSMDGPSSNAANPDIRKYFADHSNNMILDKNGVYSEILNSDLVTDIPSPWSTNLKDIAVDANDPSVESDDKKVSRKYGLTKSNEIWMNDDAGVPHTMEPLNSAAENAAAKAKFISVKERLQFWIINEDNQLFLINFVGGILSWKFYILSSGNSDGDLPSGANAIISAFQCSESTSHLCVLDNKNKTWAWKTSGGGRWSAFDTGLPK